MAMIAEITTDDLAALLGTVHLVDVREVEEYTDGHVSGALFAPLSELPDMTHQFRRDEVNYVICRSGGRSAKACEFLAGLGYDVVNIAGGTMAWVMGGRSVVAGDQPA
jgi:rhodanese-related sulfurtransferase